MSDQSVATGGCLCGELKYEVKGDPLWVAHCHCFSCRRNTGAPVTTFVGFPIAAFRYVTGSPKVFASSPGVRRSFCGTCGTPISYESDKLADEIHLYLSTLDNPDDYVAQTHVFTEESVSWFKIDDDIPRYRTTRR